jgi:demethylmenaquinone methyltransferase/2-methoxy-6-polyprenyl-1,4-benzoquinol methylase
LYLKHILPKLSALFSKSPDAYDYLAESIAAWPNQKALKLDIEKAGFSAVKFRNLTLGIVALHKAVK